MPKWVGKVILGVAGFGAGVLWSPLHGALEFRHAMKKLQAASTNNNEAASVFVGLTGATVTALYVSDGGSLLVGTSRGSAFILDRESGFRPIWIKESNSPPDPIIAFVMDRMDYRPVSFWQDNSCPKYGVARGSGGGELGFTWCGIFYRDLSAPGGASQPFRLIHKQLGITSAVLAGDRLLWLTAEGRVFAARFRDGQVEAMHELPPLGYGCKVGWLNEKGVAVGGCGTTIFLLSERNEWQVWDGTGSKRLVGCQWQNRPECFVYDRGKNSLGIIGPEMKFRTLVKDFHFSPLTIAADAGTQRVYVGTVGFGVWSFRWPEEIDTRRGHSAASHNF